MQAWGDTVTANENTVYMNKDIQQPKLFSFFQGECREYMMSDMQTLGRKSTGNNPDIDLTSPVVSRAHGEFITNAAGSKYRDVGSSNGTYLNGHRLTPGFPEDLNDGDIIKIHGKDDEKHLLDVILVYSTSYQSGTKWVTMPLSDDIAEIAVGRKEGLKLVDTAVSRRHASFFHRECHD